MSRNKILHFHIPKTAGTALREYFRSQLGEERVSAGFNGLQIDEAMLRWPEAEVLSGHFRVERGDRLPQDWTNLTCLRNPSDRLISEFFFHKSEQDARLLDSRMRQMSFPEYVEHVQQNQAGVALVQINMLWPLGTDASGQLTANEKVTAAQRALDQFHLVGLQEELEDLICMITARMRWPEGQLPRINVTRGRPTLSDLSAQETRALQQLLGAEIEVYEFARSRFQRDRREYIRSAPAAPRTGSVAIPAVARPKQPRNFGDKRCELLAAEVRGGRSGTAVVCGDQAILELRFAVREALSQVNIGFSIRDEAGTLLFGTNSLLLGSAYALHPGEYTARFEFLNRLGPGTYQVDCSFIRTKSHHDDCYHWVERATRFEVYDTALRNCEGRVQLDPELSLVRELYGASESVRPNRVELVLHDECESAPLNDFAAGIELATPLRSLACDADIMLPLQVSNLGSSPWPAEGRHKVTLTYRWQTAGTTVVADGIRTYLPADLQAGGSVTAQLHVRAPSQAGRLQLVISPVQEFIAWFVDRNPRSGLSLDVDVV